MMTRDYDPVTLKNLPKYAHELPQARPMPGRPLPPPPIRPTRNAVNALVKKFSKFHTA